VPTTLLSAALFVVLLFPGYVYERRRERDIPERMRSSFRETLSIVFVGVVADSVAALVLGIASAVGPSSGLNLGAFTADPGGYAQRNAERVTLWTAAMVIIAAALAYAAAARPWHRTLARRSPGYARRLGVSDPQQSAWWHLLYREHQHTSKYVACHLDDGSYVAGILHSCSRSSNETGDRDLSLRNDDVFPLIYRAKGVATVSPLANVGAVIISARRVVMLTVSYLSADARADAAAARTRGPEAPAEPAAAAPDTQAQPF
jgi:hypothetical protein